MKVTAKQIAEALQLSPSAVSLALNDKPGVSEDTKLRIFRKARELGYRTEKFVPPSGSANIRFVIYMAGRNVVKEISFHSIVLRGIEVQAKELGYNVLVSYLDIHDSTPTQIAALGQDVAGVLLLGTEFQERDSICDTILRELHCPVVVIDGNLFRNDVDCVVTDNLHGAYQAFEYLYHLGHRRIGYFRSKQQIPNFLERKRGAEMSIAQHRDLIAEELPVNFSTSKAYQDVCNWLEKKPDLPTAFFADSDVMAFGAMQAFAHHGYRIPEDVSIVGFDDMPACGMVSPPLTSIRVMKNQTGKTAMRLLHERIQAGETDSSHIHIIIATQLKLRSSVSAPKEKAGRAGTDR